MVLTQNSATPRLIVMRHAKSDWDTPVTDFERPLNTRGNANAELAGNYLRNIHIDQALVSPATRTQQTWSLLNQEAPATAVPELYHASVNSIRNIAMEFGKSNLDNSNQTILIIGHNPGCADFIGQTINQTPDGVSEYELYRFPTAAIAVIDLPLGWPSLLRGAGKLVDFFIPR